MIGQIPQISPPAWQTWWGSGSETRSEARSLLPRESARENAESRVAPREILPPAAPQPRPATLLEALIQSMGGAMTSNTLGVTINIRI